MQDTYFAEKRFFEWHKDNRSVTLRNKGGSYGGGSEVLICSPIKETERPEAYVLPITNGCNKNK